MTLSPLKGNKHKKNPRKDVKLPTKISGLKNMSLLWVNFYYFIEVHNTVCIPQILNNF